MNNAGKAETIFHNEVMQGIFRISSTLMSPTDDPYSIAPGAATRNSYLVMGNEKALLFDLALEESNLLEYAQNLAGMPVQTVISHGHADHLYNPENCTEIWMHPDDETLIRNGASWQPPVLSCPVMHYLHDEDSIDLGDRVIDVIHIPGHTNGSILLLDRKTRTLLSGDTCARRLLYGLMDFVPINVFCDSLRHLQTLEFDIIYSAHDRSGLPKAHINTMISIMMNELPYDEKTVEHPDIGKLNCRTYGDEYTLDYFDIAIREHRDGSCVHNLLK